MKLAEIHSVYLIGIGGIGMSALARYYKGQGKTVSGYDRTPTQLTRQLEDEGIAIHYSDESDAVLISHDPQTTLVIYTPAVPVNFGELHAFQKADYQVIKRAAALGLISREFETFAIAGTHGKTTTSAILAHVLYHTKEQCNAFIGGVSTNYNSNCIVVPDAQRMVVEADEFDRSFLQLKPNYSIITTIDSDHLDIYGDGAELVASFQEFAQRTNESGALFLQAAVAPELGKQQVPVFTYGFDCEADWVGSNLVYEEGQFYFDIQHNETRYERVKFGLPGKHNAENALAVFALCHFIGVDETLLRQTFASFKGVKRRFEYHIRRDDLTIIDDYAHHPTEIKAFLNAVRAIYPNHKITLVFQPHLYSRTRDFMDDFIQTLSQTDQLFLLPIYPAREEPIPSVSSQKIFNQINLTHKILSDKTTIVEDLKKTDHEIILIVGAGDIDTCIQPIVNAFQ